MEFTMKFDGTPLPIRISDVGGRGPMSQEVTRQSINARAGSLFQKRRTPERILSVSFSMKGESYEDLRVKVDELNRLLYVSEAKSIVFSDEPNRTYYGMLDGEPEWEEIVYIGKGTINFVCFDPYKYGLEQTYILSAPGESETVLTLFANQSSGGFASNVGLVNEQPVFTATFSDKASEYKISHQESGKYIRVIYGFVKGDVLKIDATRRKITINNNLQMPSLDMKSGWFNLQRGDNHFTITPTVTTTKISYRPRWL